MTTENRLIEKIVGAARLPGKKAAGAKLRLGIGDDAAVIAGDGKTDWVVSCDAFLQGVHFLSDAHPADSVGYKALARATSDLAAMGATPRFFLLTLALPENRTGKWLDQFLGGLGRAAKEFGMTLAGGDTTRSERVFLDMTVIGEIARGKAVRRSGARTGDIIYVSGTLGTAVLGLRAAVRNRSQRKDFWYKNGLKRPLKSHFYPRIRHVLGAYLAGHRVASAMMDLSDGLSTDLRRLCDASRVGARLFADRIPCVRLPGGAEADLDPLELALNGGEDYELLFTVPPRKEKLLRRAPGFKELTAIGRIEPGREIVIVGKDGKARPLASGGWDPFRAKPKRRNAR